MDRLPSNGDVVLLQVLYVLYRPIRWSRAVAHTVHGGLEARPTSHPSTQARVAGQELTRGIGLYPAIAMATSERCKLDQFLGIDLIDTNNW